MLCVKNKTILAKILASKDQYQLGSTTVYTVYYTVYCKQHEHFT